MKKKILCLYLALAAVAARGQHYFKDLLSNAASAQKHAITKKNKVKEITFLSFDADNKSIEGFSSIQTITPDFSEVLTSTTTTLTGSTISQSWYNPEDRLTKSMDSSDGSKLISTYEYNSLRQLIRIEYTTTSAGDFAIKEIHQWMYNGQGKPIKMQKIKNGKDTTFVEFIFDEKGNIAEEKSMLRGKALPAIFYYYNEENRLTDIVRYNIAAKRLLPDYVFEYDENGRLGSMIVVPEEGSDYQKWYYSYDEDGLKILDACYSKVKTLIARVEYQYQYY